jgi:hypothetical protein
MARQGSGLAAARLAATGGALAAVGDVALDGAGIAGANAGLGSAAADLVLDGGMGDAWMGVVGDVGDAMVGAGEAVVDGVVGVATDTVVSSLPTLAGVAYLRSILPDWLLSGGTMALLGELVFAAFVLRTGAKAFAGDAPADVMEVHDLAPLESKPQSVDTTLGVVHEVPELLIAKLNATASAIASDDVQPNTTFKS